MREWAEIREEHLGEATRSIRQLSGWWKQVASTMI
jgi:hypothetical protein